ncbi:MAG: cytochrome-c peroxidase [Flavobacteriales bacterium]|nr:cytochrome-c peroxidase [Flavobacteriales bacterium]
MNKRMTWGTLFLLVGIVSLSSCRKDPEEAEVISTPTDYDKVLTDALMDASNGEGLEFFMMPASNDLAGIPQDPLNPLSNAKVQLGKLLFHETGLARSPKLEDEGLQTYSCSSCHHAWAGFQANMQQGIGEGGLGFGIAGEGRIPNPMYPLDSIDVQPLRTPSAMNQAYQKVMLWNGQFGATGPNQGTEALWDPATPVWNNQFGLEGLETQAVAGLTVHRMNMNEEVCQDFSLYEDLFDVSFPGWPQETRYTARTAGMAIAAYERTLLSNEAPFQLWLQGDAGAMTNSEKRGAALFFGKAECSSCHTGPALNTMTFYALGMNDMEGPGTYGGAGSENVANKGRGSFTQDPADDYKFKTPQLYNLKDSPFYGHGGTFTSVREVIEYKNNATAENANVPGSQLADQFHPLGLTDSEIDDLVNFIENALYDDNLLRYVPTDLPSGNCFPNADPISQIDQGCIQ